MERERERERGGGGGRWEVRETMCLVGIMKNSQDGILEGLQLFDLPL